MKKQTSLPRSIRFLLSAVSLMFLVATSACGGGDTACEAAGKALCAEACACGAECAMGDATFQISFDDQADCEAFMVGIGCMGDDGSLDAEFDSCTEALDNAQCIDPGDGSMILESPAACDI